MSLSAPTGAAAANKLAPESDGADTPSAARTGRLEGWRGEGCCQKHVAALRQRYDLTL